jgi:hypothetical protein
LHCHCIYLSETNAIKNIFENNLRQTLIFYEDAVNLDDRSACFGGTSPRIKEIVILSPAWRGLVATEIDSRRGIGCQGYFYFKKDKVVFNKALWMKDLFCSLRRGNRTYIHS